MRKAVAQHAGQRSLDYIFAMLKKSMLPHRYLFFAFIFVYEEKLAALTMHPESVGHYDVLYAIRRWPGTCTDIYTYKATFFSSYFN
jgi:hypothetical protein